MDESVQIQPQERGSASSALTLGAASKPQRANSRLVLAGKRVLLVEDRFVLAEEVMDMLLLLGCEPIGPAGTLAEALDLVRTCASEVDAALLDINLNGEMAYPVAEALQTAGKPFAFATGYNDAAIAPRWRHVPRLEKPYGAVSLYDTLDYLLGSFSLPQAGDESVSGPVTQGQRRVDLRFETARRFRERRMENVVLHKWQAVAAES